jgi:DGQHR domain-containing protein
MSEFRYECLIPYQAKGRDIFTFCASVDEILEFAAVERIGRSSDGKLRGFQRPHVAKHISEIRDYLSEDDAILPNAVVIAFSRNAVVKNRGNGTGILHIARGDQCEALIVDGQQRLAALQGIPGKRFQVLVAGFLCEDMEELKRQFILINNARPLPKSLIYELLPSAGHMPDRLSTRARAAKLVEQLNFDPSSSLYREIRQHTNPTGVVRDTAIQRVAISSMNDGALRHLAAEDPNLESAFHFLSNFFDAVKTVFHVDWTGHDPRTSRLVHGVGIVSLGYVAEFIHSRTNALTKSEFEEGLRPLVGQTYWSSGSWPFGAGDRRPWNALQNVARDWTQLADYLIGVLTRRVISAAQPWSSPARQ